MPLPRSAPRVPALAAALIAFHITCTAGVPPLFPVSLAPPPVPSGRSIPLPYPPSDTAADSLAAVPDTLPGVSTVKVVMVGGAIAGAMIGIHLYQESGWWKYNRAPFHFEEDLTYGLGVDKIGHFYGTSLWAFGIRKALVWADVPGRQALYYGSGGALLFQTFLEIEDGFSAWGFDRVDFLCDVGGAAWPIAQHFCPVLAEVDFKLSYRPSELLNTDAGAGFAGQEHLVADDYEGQTFWLSIPPEKLLPDAAADIWPDFLDVAVGYGVRNVAGVNGEPYPVVFIALDYDVKRIIPQTSPFLVTLSEALNFIHFPAPAIQLSPNYVFYGLYF